MGEGVVGEGHRFALSLAKSKLTNENYYNEMWNGISYLKLLQRYVNDPSSHLSLLSSLHVYFLFSYFFYYFFFFYFILLFLLFFIIIFYFIFYLLFCYF